MSNYLCALAIAASAGMVGTAEARAASVAGTLTCTIASVPEDPKSDIALSCNFATPSGWKQGYEGTASRASSATFPTGKHVLVWSVVVKDEADRPALDGRYRGRTGGTDAGVLVGGPQDSVRLESASGSAQIAAPPALTELSLQSTDKQASIASAREAS